MSRFALENIAQATNGQLHGVGGVDTISIDSRTVQPGALFIALQGPTFDGHDYLAQAQAKGAAAVMVNHPVTTPLPMIVVKNTRRALGAIGHMHRAQLNLPIIAVTGSNGKTTVKEMLAAILSEQGPVLKTQGNFNNDIGLPLTLLNIHPQHQYAVIEMGANHLHEIAYLTQLTQPNVAIITNAGQAHIEGFGGRDNIAAGKGEIFTGLTTDGVAVINRNDHYAERWMQMAANKQIITFGMDQAAQVCAQSETLTVHFDQRGFRTEFLLQIGSAQQAIVLSLAGEHNVMNALAAAAASTALGSSITQIAQGLARMQPVAGRLQPKLGLAQTRVIDDTYNANPTSLQVALRVLRQCPGERWLVLGDMGELGTAGQDLHAQMGHLAREQGVTRLWAVGPLCQAAIAAYGAGGAHFEHKQALIGALQQALKEDVVMLIKGSRTMQMEQVVQAMSATCQREVPAC